MNKIRTGDKVVVIAGRDRGARGEVTRVLKDGLGKPEKVVVSGVNLLTHFDRPNPQKNEPGGRNKREAPLHISNVAIADENGVPMRVKIKQGEKGRREREFVLSARRSKQQ